MKCKTALLAVLMMGFSMSVSAKVPLVDAPPPEVTEDARPVSAKEVQASEKPLSDGAVETTVKGNKERGVRVTQSGNGDKIEEFYQGSQVYQIRVTPRVGKPYYIQPQNADDTDALRTNPTSNWKLFDF